MKNKKYRVTIQQQGNWKSRKSIGTASLASHLGAYWALKIGRIVKHPKTFMDGTGKKRVKVRGKFIIDIYIR